MDSNSSLSSVFSLLLLVLMAAILEVAAANPNQHVHKVWLHSLLSADSNCIEFNESTATKGSSSVLKLVSTHGPCSPFPNSTSHPDITELLLHDEDRVKWVQSRVKSGDVETDQAILPALWGNPLGTLNFVVSVGLGLPKQNFLVTFDTGSDLTWVQCEPCLISCHPQLGPGFNPSRSSTFRFSTCSSSDCVELGSEKYSAGCSTDRCVYRVPYSDGSSTVGFLGHDTLTLTPADVIAGFSFGCGESNTGLFGKEAGLLGLGRKKLSVVSQTAKRYGNVFSYCLPTGRSAGFLTFGSDHGSGSASYTPLLTRPQNPTFYYVSLVGISVGGQLLPVPASIFSSSGTLLDSGTVITRLPNRVYGVLRSTFMKWMSKYRLGQPLGILDTCYDFSGYTTILVPRVGFYFQGGAKLVLPPENVFLPLNGNRLCFAFASTAGSAIIGNWQQRTTQIVHDLAHSRIGFRPGACP